MENIQARAALDRIRGIMEEKGRAVVAIDGRCASGKTSFARLIDGLFPCNILHMDDFYLPSRMRRADWTEIPGGNMDFARLCREALEPARAGEDILYRPYDCQKGRIVEESLLPGRPFTVVEGSYSHHPALTEHYDLKIFLTCSKELQAERLRQREGERAAAFMERWIPLEENYFRRFGIRQGSDLVVDTGK